MTDHAGFAEDDGDTPRLWLPPRRGLRALAAILLFVAALGVPAMAFVGEDPSGIRTDIVRGGDLLAFWGGAAVLHEGAPSRLYVRKASAVHERAVWRSIGSGYRLVYPPPVYQLLQPAVPLGYPSAVRLAILGFGLAGFVGLWVLSRGLSDLGPRWVRFGLLAGSPPALILTFTGHIGGLWLLSVGVGFALLWRRRDGAGGLVLALCCAKPTIGLAAVVCLLVSRRWRAVGAFAVGGLLILLLSVSFGGTAPWRAWVELMVGAGEVGQKMWLFPHRQLTLRTLVALPAWKTSAAPALSIAGTLLGAGLVLHVARSARGQTPRLDALRIAAVFSATLLAVPHLFDYDLALHAPGWLASAALLVSGSALRPRLGWTLLTAAWAAPLLWPVAYFAGLSLGTVALLAWVLWMSAELRGGSGLVDSAAQ